MSNTPHNEELKEMIDDEDNNYLNSNDLYFEDEPYNYDEQENNREVSVPHLNIKLFKESSIDNVKKNEIIDEKDINLEINIQDLSNCTDNNDDECFMTHKITKKKSKKNKGRKDLISNNILKSEKPFTISCVFKVGDDLRQDSLALQVIHIFKEIFHEHNLKLFLYPYKTISTITSVHKDLGGLIECVPDCDSRDQIGKTYDTNLYEYFLCTFGQENSNEYREARKNFIESLAAYCVISYILQIKDRHNGNILIDKHGHIIHIDFGFIFDISPGRNMRFEKAAFKLTKEMIQIMGHSTNSEPYQMFVDLTIRGFLASRDNMDKLLDPVVLMFNSGLECFRENSIKNFIERFKLDLNEDEAALYMRGLIDEAENNWRTNMYDWIQSKQNKINY
jgi:phosphatidylinositol 4-kinase